MTLFPISKTAKITGITTSCLRIWELRYGWPRPERSGAGK
jgi:DNA-binding transcriptional MerR regulator